MRRFWYLSVFWKTFNFNIPGPLSGPTSIKLTTIRNDGDQSGLPDDEEEVADWISSSDSTTDDSIILSVVWKVWTIVMMIKITDNKQQTLQWINSWSISDQMPSQWREGKPLAWDATVIQTHWIAVLSNTRLPASRNTVKFTNFPNLSTPT